MHQDYHQRPETVFAGEEADLLDAMEIMKPLVASLGVEMVKKISIRLANDTDERRGSRVGH